MTDFSLPVAILLFFLLVATDWLWTLWMMAVEKRKPEKAALFSVMIYALTAATTIGYVENHWYLIPILLGAAIGSYLAIKTAKERHD